MDFLTSSNMCLNVFESVSSAGHLFNYSVKEEKTELTKEHKRENKCVCFRTLSLLTLLVVIHQVAEQRELKISG